MIAVSRPRPAMERRNTRLLAAPKTRGKVTVNDLRKSIATDSRAAEVVRLREDEGLTFVQIGERFGFTHQHASNLYRAAKRAQVVAE